MTQVTALTDRFDRALLYATHVHGGQTRKATPVPYLAHLLAVAATVLEYGGSEDMAIAALLHDAVEDQGGEPRLAGIRNRFGDRVADIVRSCSDSPAAAHQPKEDWHIRKTRHVERLAEGIDTLTGESRTNGLWWAMKPISYARHRFPPDVIGHAVWLYLRFTLSYRDVEDLLAERGLEVSNESIRRWVLKFGPAIARNLRSARPRPHNHWHLDEMVVSIGGQRMYM